MTHSHSLQVALQQMYQSYHEADPETHTPPIPTAQVRSQTCMTSRMQHCTENANNTGLPPECFMGQYDSRLGPLQSAFLSLSKGPGRCSTMDDESSITCQCCFMPCCVAKACITFVCLLRLVLTWLLTHLSCSAAACSINQFIMFLVHDSLCSADWYI